jgi:hypothetical protein
LGQRQRGETSTSSLRKRARAACSGGHHDRSSRNQPTQYFVAATTLVATTALPAIASVAQTPREEKCDPTPRLPDQSGAAGAHSNSAIAMMPPGKAVPASEQERVLGVKIARAMLSGPPEITKDATVAEMGADGTLIILRQGTNDWVCVPGNEDEIGNVPMCADPMGLQWMLDIMAKKPKPTNTAPGLIYMLCGATQHSNTDPFDRTSPAIPIGPHWMIIWPYEAKRCGLPNPTCASWGGCGVFLAGRLESDQLVRRYAEPI